MILFWNNYLPVFRRLNFYEIILQEVKEPMEECYEAMNNCFLTANFGTENIDYNLSTKLNVFTNFCVMYCRVLEHRNMKDQAVKVCDNLLAKNLPPHH